MTVMVWGLRLERLRVKGAVRSLPSTTVMSLMEMLGKSSLVMVPVTAVVVPMV